MSAPFPQITPEQARASLLANTQTGSLFDLPNVGRYLRDVKNAGQWALPYLGAATASAPAYAIGAAKYGVPEVRKGYRQDGIVGALGGLNEAARKVPVIGDASVDLMDAATQYAEEQGAPAPAMFLADLLAPDPTGKIGALASGAAALAKGMGGLNLAVIPAFVGSPRRWDVNPELGRLTTRMDKIGTGEGNQAFSYGPYSAEKRGTAEQYADETNRGPLTWRGRDVDSIWTAEIEERHADELAGMDDRERDLMTYILAETSQVNSLEEADSILRGGEGWDLWQKHRAEFADPPEPDASIYGVLHDVEPEELVDWDARLQDLPKEQLFAIDRVWRKFHPAGLFDMYNQPRFDDLSYGSTHESLLETLQSKRSDKTRAELNAELTQMFADEGGFKGTQFYDGNSRVFSQFAIKGVTPETHEIGKQAGSNRWAFYDKETGLFDSDLPTFSREQDAQRALDGDYDLSRNYVMYSDDYTYVDPSRTDPDLIGDMPVGTPWRTIEPGTPFGVRTPQGASEFGGYPFNPGPVREGHAYRGMTKAEYDATVGAGLGVQSRSDWSMPGEGTSFARDFATAEDYANYGRTNPAQTGEPTYLVEVAGADELLPGVGNTDYLRSEEALPAERVSRVWEMSADGQGGVSAREIGAPQAAPDEAVPVISTTQSGTGTLEGALGPHKSQLAVEYDEGIIGAYNDAHGTDYDARSVFDLDPEEVKGSDLFHSSPVCKNLSCAKRGRAINEDDQKMADKVVEVVQGARPPAVTIENVPGYEKTVLFDEIMDALDAEGYSVDAQVVDAADYGGAQHRSRLIIRASRDGEVPPLPEPTGSRDWFETIEDLIDDAPDMPFRGRSKADEGWEIKRLRQDIADGRLDPEKPIITMGGSADSKHAYAANAGGPSPTITSTAGSVPRIVMPDGRVKRVTGRMLARLMGLPDDFKIPENWGQAKKVLGNGIHGEITRQMIAPMAEIGRRSNKGKN